MKMANWIKWVLAACLCVSIFPGGSARYKMRRPPPPPQVYKKNWPIAQRISMGNTIHIGGGFSQKRPTYKPTNYRIRRPPVFNVLPTAWKTQAILGPMNNLAVLPLRPPVKEFHSMNKVPEYSPEYSPEYRPEAAVMPATHRTHVDEDKGPIHTIPAPNLGPADKPYNLGANSQENNPVESIRNYPADLSYNSNPQGNHVSNFAFGTIGTSAPSPQRTVTSPTSTQHHYEVTESNEVGFKDYRTVQPTYFTPEFDVTRLSTVVSPDLQTNEVFLNHPPGSNSGVIGTNLQFDHGQLGNPMQTNLHSSLHVGFPGTASQAPSAVGHQIPDLHVGHPAPAGPPLSATQLYDLLNSFPQQLTEQYTTGQQPQLQQHLLQQQLGQLFQPTGVTSFSQPQMHSFNYDEQANKQQQQQQQQQQQILVGQDYASGRVTADYNLEPQTNENLRSSNILPLHEEVSYPADAADQSENNIEYEESSNQQGQSTYFTKVGKDGSIATQFYTTLPSREAAEKLAALAAAGNVNSHLIGQLRKHQESQQNEGPMPPNHKDEEYRVIETSDQDPAQYNQQQEEYVDRQNYHRQQLQQQQQEMNDRYQQQQRQEQRQQDEQKNPLRIMVPELEEYSEDLEQQPSGGNTNAAEEYEYEEESAETTEVSPTSASGAKSTYKQKSITEYGTRLSSKTGK
ncbi:putative uncharacterized protein DDB_G0271606 [Cephus cinctus]|uniref:Uncharacterized protein n=1 Tax=Cephus cinctus TaxID=211228 RepID=A0AAJ7RB42_CEPCN|nr:putative uncharacterized protein DDB_G0271606 [Cephus cinctus]XP_024937588.1 putative uncharacterized protein DDB_G0271606 [Cephus cinctus]